MTSRPLTAAEIAAEEKKRATDERRNLLELSRDLQNFFVTEHDNMLPRQVVNIIIDFFRPHGWDGWSFYMVATRQASWAAIIGKDGGIWTSMHNNPDLAVNNIQYWECKNLDKDWDKAADSVKFRTDQYIRVSTDTELIRAKKGSANLCMRRLKKCIVIGGTDPDPPVPFEQLNLIVNETADKLKAFDF